MTGSVVDRDAPGQGHPPDRIGHAVVIGGSIAGLMAARVLADHSDRVTILDRDVLPENCEARSGVAQSSHAHILLPGGDAIIERLLPGIRAERLVAGARDVDLFRDLVWLTPAGWGVRCPSSLHLVSCSRELLEWAVRRRVVALPGVEVEGGRAVTGLVADGNRITGVRLDHGGTMSADLVVDATGRVSGAPAWLQAIGYQPPAETIVDGGIGYASQIIDAPYDAIPGALAAYVQLAPPEHGRCGAALPIENGRWILTLWGTREQHPPRDQPGFDAFARSLRHPILADLAAAGSPASPISVYRATANRVRHFERIRNRDRPIGFLVTGDAACAFNPIYGQGMSVAALAADVLGACLREGPTPLGLTRRFAPALARANKVPWMLATATDFDLAGIRPPHGIPTLNRYLAKVLYAATQSEPTRLRVLQVISMMKPPQSLFAPRVMANALRRRTPSKSELTAAIAAGPTKDTGSIQR